MHDINQPQRLPGLGGAGIAAQAGAETVEAGA
jgi:hypothetical protein